MKTGNNKHSLYFDSFMGGTLYKNAVTSQKAIHPQWTWIVIFLTDYDPFTTRWWKPICFIDTALIQPNEESLFIFSIQPLLLNGSNHKVKKTKKQVTFLLSYYIVDDTINCNSPQYFDQWEGEKSQTGIQSALVCNLTIKARIPPLFFTATVCEFSNQHN